MKNIWIVKFLFRAFLGIGIILMVNQILVDRNFLATVQTNLFSFFTSGILGLPGVCALYGMAFYLFL